MLQIFLGSNLLIPLQLSGGETTQYPQVLIYNSLGALLSTNNMTHISSGLYSYTWTPSSKGNYTAVFKIYTDVGHITLSTDYGIISDDIIVLEDLEDEVDAIKAKTDNLTADPASATNITNAITSIKGTDDRDNTEIYNQISGGFVEPKNFNIAGR